MNGEESFSKTFATLTGYAPFPWQKCLFERFLDNDIPDTVCIPTGLGKTNVIAVWLLALMHRPDKLPRRLVYCLPMRVLVEQTWANAVRWLDRANLLGGQAVFDRAGKLDRYEPDFSRSSRVTVHTLMGGEEAGEWDVYPERKAIIIGTQDMLLSRALNRGYAASRARWPMQFGLLHTDSLWVFDEIQLMGSGLATTAQLEAFRNLLGSEDGHGCRSMWMSATLDQKWLETVDFKTILSNRSEERRLTFNFEKEISSPEIPPVAQKVLDDRWTAKKPLSKSGAAMGDAAALAKEVCKTHIAGTRTIVVVNTVKRACELHTAIRKTWTFASNGRLILLHSRFRPADRKDCVDAALADPPAKGTIVVSTQVIEAGVDVDATTLFTELAPWASLVQRFGRCNRRGEEKEKATVHWMDVHDKEAAPYDAHDLQDARHILGTLSDVSLASLSALTVQLPFEHTHVIRKRDLIDLFDTTPDLAGNDIDIDRFVRDVEDSDVRVFWRNYGDPKKGASPNRIDGRDADPDEPRAEPAPRRAELCSVPIGNDKSPGFRQFAKRHSGQVWRWDFLEKKWAKAEADKIAPGQVFLVHGDAGGYSVEKGWDQASTDCVEPITLPANVTINTPDATDDDRQCRIGAWQTIAEHTDEVCRELDVIVAAIALESSDLDVLRKAARWHDRGKAHEIFVNSLPDGVPDAAKVWAKGAGGWKRYARPHFRHELASALAVLLESDGKIPPDTRDLIAYLVAAHHGKVRLSIRSLPNEKRPVGNLRFARGVWDGDTLQATDLGGGINAPAVTLSLEPMELGLCEQPAFAGQPSWAERTIRLRDTLGPFRLAYLEAVLRAADMRASKAAGLHAATNHPVDSSVDTREADHG